MKTRVGGGVMLVLLCSLQAFAQVGIWKNYTSMQDVRAVARNGNTVWAATSGGLFAWTEGSATYTRYTSADGLQSTDLSAIAIDRNGDVWTGAETGIIHVYSPATNKWRYVFDIANSNKPNKRINSISVYGDTLLICSAFGLSIFHIDQFQFGDTYTKFGSLAGGVTVSVLSAEIQDGSIWAAVTDGQVVNRVASASLSNPNLLPPESWTLHAIGNGANVPGQLQRFNNKLYLATTVGLYVLEGNSWTPVAAFAGRYLVALASSVNKLAVVGQDSIVDTLSTQGLSGHYGVSLPAAATSVTLGSTGVPVVGVTGLGLLTLTNTGWQSHFPNGPASNQFISVAVDPDGKVWGASGYVGGKGFYRFDGKSWKSFNQHSSRLPFDDYYRVSVACNGDVWAGSWKRGTVLMPHGTDDVDTANIFGRNVGMWGTPDDTGAVVTGTAVCDNNGNVWMTILFPFDKHTLAIRKANGTWTTLPVYIQGVPHGYITDRQVTRALAVDASNNIWTTAVTSGPLGVACLNNLGSLTDSVAETFISSADGLPSSDVRTIVADRENDIWVGTGNGIAIIHATGGVASNKPLQGTGINAIAIDPLNQKWIATNDGVILLSPDGTQPLAQYDVANTSGKIIDNEIRDIAVDPKSGTIYFATNNGLASLTTTAVQPKESFDVLAISPNPYRIPNPLPLTIDGLVEGSRIKILTVDGHLIRELATPGGRIGFWDGKDDTGKDVASGVYLVVGYSDTDKSKVGKGKVAVLRR